MKHGKHQITTAPSALIMQKVMECSAKGILSTALLLFHNTTFPSQPSHDANSILEHWIQQGALSIETRTAKEDWPAARRMVKTDPGWRAWLTNRRRIVDEWFKTHIDRFELVSGYPNDYVDRSTGKALDWTPQSPEPDRSEGRQAERQHAAWVAITRQYNISRTLDAAKLYRLTGETRYLELAASQLDFYAEYYMKWPLRRAIGNARMLAQSLDEAASIIELVEAARHISSAIEERRLKQWRKGLFEPVSSNLQTYRDRDLNNIDLWCAAALLHIALYLDDTTLLNAALHGSRGLDAILQDRAIEDGVWYEGSFSYSAQVLITLGKIFDGYASMRGSQPPERYSTAAKKLLLGPLLFRYSNFTLPNPGNARSRTPPIDLLVLLSLNRHIPTKLGYASASQKRNWETLLDPPEQPKYETEPKMPASPPVVIARNARMAMLRQAEWELFVRVGQATPNHAQEEAMNYELVHAGRNIVHDAGTAPTYSSPLHQNYFSLGIGNNVPLIDGKGQQHWNPGTLDLTESPTPTLKVTHKKYHVEYEATRIYHLSTAGFSETTRLTNIDTSAPPRRLGVVINSSCNILEQSTEVRTTAADSLPDPFMPELEHWQDTKISKRTRSWSSKLDCEGEKYTIQVESPQTFLAITGVTPSTPLPATRTGIYIVTKGRNTEITTTIRKEPPPQH